MTANRACLQAQIVLLFIWTASAQPTYTTPKVVSPSKKEVLYYRQQASVQIGCSATGQPQPTYKWRQNETEIQQIATISVNSATGALTIPSLQGQQVGKYRCIASNIVDSNTPVISMSPNIYVWMIKLETFGSPTPLTHVVPEYSYLKMACGDTRASTAPDLAYTWHEMENRTVLDVQQGRMFVDIAGSLHIAYIKKLDEGFKGLGCGVSALMGATIQTSYGVSHKLTVVNNPAYQRVVPVFRYSNTGVKALINSTARLECVFSGFDAYQPQSPLQSWETPSGQLYLGSVKYNVSEFGRMLFVKHVEAADEKAYVCIARNAGGISNSTVYLDVTSGPIFTNGPPVDRTVLEGTNVQLSCAARSFSGEAPPTRYEWYFNSEKIGQQYDPTKFSISANREVLTVKNPSNTMCIQCEVTNHIDTTFANVCVNVKVAIRIVSQPPTVQNISYGGVVNLTVTAITDATLPVSYRWQVNSTVYPGTPPHVVFNSTNKHAYIVTGQLTKAQYTSIGGLYKITVYNTNGSKSVTTQVNLAPPPVGPSFPMGPPPNVTAVEGKDAQFHCEATVPAGEAPLRPTVWSFQGIPITGTYDPSKYGLSNGGKTFTIKTVNKATHNNKCIRCEVSNGLDNISANACLRVLLPISIVKKPPVTQTIYFRGTVDLTVKATTDPSLTLSYRWKINATTYNSVPPSVYFDPTSQESYINTSSMTKAQFSSIGGLYVITVHHPYESTFAETTVVASAASTEPYFTNGPPGNQTVIEGSGVRLQCDSTVPTGGTPLRETLWYINGNWLNNNTYDRSKYNFSNNNAALTIMRVTKAGDSVCIRCEVSNAYDTIAATPCLTVLHENKFDISSNDSTLTLKKVQKSVVPICVRCEVSNGVDTIYASIYVNLLLPITVLTQPPATQNITYKSFVNLTVKATTDPSVTLSSRWTFNGATCNNTPPFVDVNITTQEAYINTGELTVDEYKTIAGIYTITVYHMYESLCVETEVIALSPTDGPSFPDGPPQNQTVIQGSDVQIHCQATVPPSEQPLKHHVWYADGAKLDKAYEEDKFHISPDYNTFTLKKVQKAAVPICVRCEVSNGVDTITASIYVNVLLAIKIVKQPPKVQTIQKGGTVDLTVQATTDPSMTLNVRYIDCGMWQGWEFNNGTFNGNITAPPISFNVTPMEAHIDTSNMTTDEFEAMVGVYSIIIYHDYENKTVTTTVSRLIPTESEKSRLLSDLWIAIITLGCLVLNTATVLMCYVWCGRSAKNTEGQGEEGGKGHSELNSPQSVTTASGAAVTEAASSGGSTAIDLARIDTASSWGVSSKTST